MFTFQISISRLIIAHYQKNCNIRSYLKFVGKNLFFILPIIDKLFIIIVKSFYSLNKKTEGENYGAD